MNELHDLERLISIRIIQEDVESIYSLLTTETDPIFGMDIIPYYALFVQAYREFMGDKFLPESTATEIKDIRNHIKILAENFRKSKRKIAEIDKQQNEYFKSKLKFNFLKKWNIHLNLGTYWTADHHIIGNTQQLASFLGIKSFDNSAKKRQYELGYHIGSFVASTRAKFTESMGEVQRNRTSVSIKYYFDLNTNRDNSLFIDNSLKELNLFFLDLLCNMNFIKYILRELFEDGNTWVFRIEYIVSYYTLRALERLKNYCENNNDVALDTKDIADILTQGEKFFNTKLRNCMMHYNLTNAGVITFENMDKPFYGIIETCFNGKSYREYLASLHNLSDNIIRYLDKRFDYSNITLKRL